MDDKSFSKSFDNVFFKEHDCSSIRSPFPYSAWALSPSASTSTAGRRCSSSTSPSRPSSKSFFYWTPSSICQVLNLKIDSVLRCSFSGLKRLCQHLRVPSDLVQAAAQKASGGSGGRGRPKRSGGGRQLGGSFKSRTGGGGKMPQNLERTIITPSLLNFLARRLRKR